MFKVYDNGGKTVDRYTIYLYKWDSEFLVYRPDGCITTSGIPSEFWQHSEFDPDVVGNGEERIDVMHLPTGARRSLLKELQLED